MQNSNSLTMQPARGLARRLSEAPAGSQPWQQLCREQIHTIFEDCFQKRVTILKTVQDMSWPTSLDTAKASMVSVLKVSHNVSEEVASQIVEAKWPSHPGLENDGGLYTTNVYCWRYDDASLWRGQPDTTKVCGLAKSFICVGFKKDSPLCSRDRTFDGFSCLRFGDGQARGVALRLAWSILERNILSGEILHSMSLKAIVDSLMSIPTCFDGNGQDEKSMVIRQAVRQNVKATMTVLVNTVDWATIVINLTASSTNPLELLSPTPALTRKSNGFRLLEMLTSVTSSYEAAVDEEGVVMSPAAKRQRRGRRCARTALDIAGGNSTLDDPAQIRIGSLKLTAIKNILAYATEASFTTLSTHLVWAGDYKYSGLSDNILAHKHLWPGSMPNQTVLPQPNQLQICLATHKIAEKMAPQRLTTAFLQYEEELTVEMHEMLVTKLLYFFEDEALHVVDPSKRLKFRPTVETVDTCRLVIQHWQQSIKQCALADLSEEDFKELEAAVLYGDAMDSQVIKALQRFPVKWNMSMLPDLKAGMPDDLVDDSETLLEKTELNLWHARLEEFEAKLKIDQAKIRTMFAGSGLLNDQLDWIRHMKMTEQAVTAAELVNQFTRVYVHALADLGCVACRFALSVVSVGCVLNIVVTYLPFLIPC